MEVNPKKEISTRVDLISDTENHGPPSLETLQHEFMMLKTMSYPYAEYKTRLKNLAAIYIPATIMLGDYYLNRPLVSFIDKANNLIKAILQFEKVAPASIIACERLASIYYDDPVFDKRYEKTLFWTKTGIDLGSNTNLHATESKVAYANLNFRLACMYDMNLGVKRNPQLALKHFKIAAEHGHTEAAAEVRAERERSRNIISQVIELTPT